MKICRYCGGALFDIIGGFMKVCLDCFSFEKMTKEEMEKIEQKGMENGILYNRKNK